MSEGGGAGRGDENEETQCRNKGELQDWASEETSG